MYISGAPVTAAKAGGEARPWLGFLPWLSCTRLQLWGEKKKMGGTESRLHKDARSSSRKWLFPDAAGDRRSCKAGGKKTDLESPRRCPMKV